MRHPNPEPQVLLTLTPKLLTAAGHAHGLHGDRRRAPGSHHRHLRGRQGQDHSDAGRPCDHVGRSAPPRPHLPACVSRTLQPTVFSSAAISLQGMACVSRTLQSPLLSSAATSSRLCEPHLSVPSAHFSCHIWQGILRRALFSDVLSVYKLAVTGGHMFLYESCVGYYAWDLEGVGTRVIS